MDLLGRIELLERHIQALTQQAASVARRLRWWRRLACSVMVLAVFSLPISLGADDRRHDGRNGEKHRGNHSKHDKHDHKDEKELRQLRDRVRALERKLQHVTSERDDNGLSELVITGANLRIVNGLGTTETANGLGNLIVGYNELRSQTEGCQNDPTDQGCLDIRTGSHNVVVGILHRFSSYGGLVVGQVSEISGPFASITGGSLHIASGDSSSITGGVGNRADGIAATVSAGQGNRASGVFSSVSGGQVNIASGEGSSVSGGGFNTASIHNASVSGGFNNTADGDSSAVAGGEFNVASGPNASVSWGFGNTAIGIASAVSGGENNLASGNESSVGGGRLRSAPAQSDWVAGALFQNQ